MKTPARLFSSLLAIASLLMPILPAAAQENPAPPPTDPPAQTVTAPAAPAEPAEPAPSEMRRLDVPPPAPAAESADDAASTEADKAAVEAEESAQPDPAEAAAEAADEPVVEHRHGRRGHQSNERVSFGHDSTLAEGESADAVVSIFGSSTSAGEVRDAVVSILGSSTSTGGAGDAVVSILGSSRVTGRRVGDAVVSVLGNTYVDAEVGDAVVAVLGNVELGPKAVVHGEVVCIGGVVKRDPSAVVHGQVNNISFGADFGGFEWLHAWVTRCLIYGRPLAFGPHLMWAWWLAIGFFTFYVILALLFPRGVDKCVTTLEQSPGYSLLTALLVTLLTPLAAVVLAITIVGTPALVIALIVAGLFGKAVMLAWVGRRITNHLGGGIWAAPAMAVLFGAIIVLLLYTVPLVGFLVAKLTSWLGLGVVVYTLIQGSKRPKAPVVAGGAPAFAAVSPSVATSDVVSPAGVSSIPATDAGSVSAGFTGVAASGPSTGTAAPAGAAAIPPLMLVSSATLPRAGFWIRIAASLLDMIIVALAGAMIPDGWEPNLLLIFAAYCCVLWGLKGTTIGGIICGLKVVRLDERKIDWPTAIVRTLGGFLSLVAAGIGFIWVAFDDQKQSWHDKIAGTTIVHVPRGVSLV